MDCVRNQKISSCKLKSYMTFNDGIGAWTEYSTFIDGNDTAPPLPCQVVDVSTDFSYYTGSYSQS